MAGNLIQVARMGNAVVVVLLHSGRDWSGLDQDLAAPQLISEVTKLFTGAENVFRLGSASIGITPDDARPGGDGIVAWQSHPDPGD
jgi:hypothetical protein